MRFAPAPPDANPNVPIFGVRLTYGVGYVTTAVANATSKVPTGAAEGCLVPATTVSTYLDLVTAWHSTQPDFMETLRQTVEPLVQIEQTIACLPADFDIDAAVGVQLDVVGEWVGRSRIVLIPLANVYFSFGIVNLGFGQGSWKGPYDPVEGLTQLDDYHYRLLLKAKIAANQWDGTTPGAVAVMDVLFGPIGSTFFVQDNGDMSAIFGMSGQLPSAVFLALFAGGYIPLKPAGVQVRYLFVSRNGNPMFGFGLDNKYISGFGRGAWGVSDLSQIQYPS